MRLSVVATMYMSEDYVEEFCERMSAQARVLTRDYEIVLVNDGSPDNALQVAKRCADLDPHIKVVDLSRNFGHHKAMMAGLAHTTGDEVFLIDIDLEEEPEWLGDFGSTLHERQCDVVFGVQAKRRGGWISRLVGRAYYAVFRILSGLTIPEDLVTARLMTRRYVDALLEFREREIEISGLWVLAGFEQVAQPITKSSTSPSTYTLRRKLSMAVDSITSFSSVPLLGIFYFGLLISFGAMTYIVYLVVNRLVLSAPLEGWTSVMASVWLLGGLLIFFIGIIGIYLAKVFSESKQRPSMIVREVYQGEAKQNPLGNEHASLTRAETGL